MNNVVLDTNIIVSAVISPNGNPAKILNMALDKTIRINLSAKILAEYEEVLSRSEFNFSSEQQNTLMLGIKKSGLLLEPTVNDVPMSDEDDRIFYDTAKENGATLITGNTKHYPVEPFIKTPSDFLASLDNGL